MYPRVGGCCGSRWAALQNGATRWRWWDAEPLAEQQGRLPRHGASRWIEAERVRRPLRPSHRNGAIGRLRWVRNAREPDRHTRKLDRARQTRRRPPREERELAATRPGSTRTDSSHTGIHTDT